ncbi:MAG: DNA cytosine methyltransferase [Methylococcales bacterium]|nr:DNA cytosine methyltransferase [Methylococcales bacterium]
MKSAISLFSGIGGLDEGLHQAGFSPVFCAELDNHAFNSLQHWCKKCKTLPLFGRDINEIEPSSLKKKLRLKINELDILAGGPPCQSFSLIGSRQAMKDDRGLLLLKMVEFAKVFKPKAVLIEQVKGLLSAKGADGKVGSALTSIIADLEDMGYTVNYKVLRAADYGVPQLRDRVFIVGLYGNKKFIFPEPTHFDPEKSCNKIQRGSPYLTVKDAIGDLPAPTKKGDPELVFSHVDITPARDIERITGVPEGECLARQFQLPLDQRQRLDPKKDTTKFRRMAWNKPSLTLRGGEAFYHPTENRYLTPKEYLRIHGFPDDHILFGPIRGRSGSVRDLDQHRLVANAVPPPLAKAVAEEIFKQLTDE